MSKFIAALGCIAGLFFVNYWALTGAWGLEVKSFPVLFGSFALTILIMCVSEAIKREDKS